LISMLTIPLETFLKDNVLYFFCGLFCTFRLLSENVIISLILTTLIIACAFYEHFTEIPIFATLLFPAIMGLIDPFSCVFIVFATIATFIRSCLQGTLLGNAIFAINEAVVLKCIYSNTSIFIHLIGILAFETVMYSGQTFFENSFLPGDLIIIAQGITVATLQIFTVIKNDELISMEHAFTVFMILGTLFFSLTHHYLSRVLFHDKNHSNNNMVYSRVIFFCLYLLVYLKYFLFPMMKYALKIHPFRWFLNHFKYDSVTVYLSVFWITCLVFTGLIMRLMTEKEDSRGDHSAIGEMQKHANLIELNTEAIGNEKTKPLSAVREGMSLDINGVTTGKILCHKRTSSSIVVGNSAVSSAAEVVRSTGSEVEEDDKIVRFHGGINFPKIIVRKAFHIITFMFIPGCLLRPHFMSASYAGAFSLFILAECIRLEFRETKFGKMLNNGMRRFTDDRDSGTLILTHSYLLFGCAIPLWLGFREKFISLLGILVLGMGDTMASLTGIYWGSHRWPGKKKTFEGTIGAILSMFLFGYLMSHFVYVKLVPFIISTICVCILEALTFQVDNLSLPLLYVALYLYLKL